MIFSLAHVCKALGHLGQQYNLMAAYAANNSCQAGLETLKNSDPVQFERIQKINTLLLLGNFGFFVWNLGKLIHIASERYTWFKLADIQYFEKAPFRFQLAILGTIVVWVLISRLLIEVINRYMNPTENPQNFVELPVHDKENIKLSWSRPFEITWAQGIHLSQITVNIALACLAGNPIFYGANTLMEGYRLFKVSQLPWLQIDRDYPNKKIHLVYGFAIFNAPGKRVYTCSTHSNYLHDFVQKIYEKTSNIEAKKEKTKTRHKVFDSVWISPNNIPHCPQCESTPPGSYYIAVAERKRNS